MASINKAKVLVKRVTLADLSSKDGLSLTMMLNGPHGIGKTQVVKQAAKDLGGICLTMDGSVLKEGDATGIPFPFKTEDGTQEVRFIKHNAINKIWRLEKYYYEKASKEGLLNGSIKVEKDSDGNEYIVRDGKKTLTKTIIDQVEAGEDNMYKLDALTADEKLKLFESGDIKPVILFIDELNRAEMQTMKELMNIILNHNVNGYILPWWVTIVGAINPSSQNSSYATTELDPAQYSRFINIKVTAKLEDWTDYALENGINTDVASAIAVSNEIFTQKDSSTEDTTEMTPDPRAWEMVSHLIDTANSINDTKYFTAEEKKTVEDDIKSLVYGKVGQTAGRTLFQNMANKENNIKPTEILTMKDIHIDPKIVEKFNRQTSLTKTIIATNVVRYLDTNINDIVKMKTSSDATKKKTYMNFFEQLKEFVNILDSSTQILFAKKVIKTGKLYNKVSGIFAKDILVNLNIAKDALNNLQNDD